MGDNDKVTVVTRHYADGTPYDLVTSGIPGPDLPPPGAVELQRFEVYLSHPDARVQTKNGEWVKEILIEVSYDAPKDGSKDSLEECDIRAKANAAAKIALDFLKVKRSPVRLAQKVVIVGDDSVASVGAASSGILPPSTEEKRTEDGEREK